MHYLFAALTFLAGFILYVFLQVFLERNGYKPGVFVQTLAMALVFSATAFVFRNSRKKHGKGKKDIAPASLSKHEVKDFSKVFTEELLVELNIYEVFIKSVDHEQFDYIIWLDAQNFERLDLDLIRKKLSKRFYAVDRIQLMQKDTMDENNVFVIRRMT